MSIGQTSLPFLYSGYIQTIPLCVPSPTKAGSSHVLTGMETSIPSPVASVSAMRVTVIVAMFSPESLMVYEASKPSAATMWSSSHLLMLFRSISAETD